MLTDHEWRLKYTPEDGDLVRRFYVPALADAVRYDRLTGYFGAGALALAARGLEGLVRNGGRMRLVVGCTLEPPEIEAIARGEALRGQVERRLAAAPLAPPDPAAADALELLAWMVGHGHLDVRVAVPCDGARRPAADAALFHEKTGVIEDRAGNRLAWTGSLNETPAGWLRNWESLNVFTSWGAEPARVDQEERNFARLWADRAERAIVLDVPDAVRRDLLRFLPAGDRPARLIADGHPPDGAPGSVRGDGDAPPPPDGVPPAAVPGRGDADVPPPPAPVGVPVRGDIPPPDGVPPAAAPVRGDGDAPPPPDGAPTADDVPPAPAATPAPAVDRRRLVWRFIARAPSLPGGGARVGEATAAVEPWPHQVRAFERLYGRWPPRLLIADEVGLGKTIQAGLLLRQAWLAGRARRILILAPKAVLRQWQIELREKFNLHWPIYDGRALVGDPAPGVPPRDAPVTPSGPAARRALVGDPAPGAPAAAARRDAPDRWHDEPAVIASSHLLRRRDRAEALLAEAAPWDLIVLDEAHHARRRAAGSRREGGPNALLKLMRGLRAKTGGLILLTATPMQVHPVEVWDLLDLLGLPPEWTEGAFLQFFETIGQPNPAADALDRMARLFQAVERDHGAVGRGDVRRLTGLSPLKANRVLRALRDAAGIPRRQLETPERRAALAVLRAHTPIRRLVSRHTRALLRRYFREGRLATPIAERRVDDRFLALTAAERELYEAVERYIGTTYDQAASAERSAVGFVMTIYRRRLASSFRALRATFERRLDAMSPGGATRPAPSGAAWDEDTPDDETADEPPDAEELAALDRRALAAEERADVERLLERIRALPPDGKLAALTGTLADLRRDGYGQVMVFTQYADTMDFLRDALRARGDLRLLCFSGRGGEVPAAAGGWRPIMRDDAKRRFREGEADVLLCTDAAAEGLNFQFCGALVNYDMPWNPMRVEQRIGRIDRLGQRHATIRVVNLHYAGTVETDVYRALRTRIGLFEQVVGRLQPILARMPGAIAGAVLGGGGGGDGDARRANVVDELARQAREAEAGGFDLDAALDDAAAPTARPPSPVTLDDLDRVIASPDLMPPGTDVQPLGRREYGLLAPGMRERVRVTTDPAYYEEHAGSVALWSPGHPLFTPPELPVDDDDGDLPAGAALKDLLER